MSNEIACLSATQLRQRIAARELSPVEVVRAALERIEAHNGELNAIVTLSGTAMDQARDLEAALARGLGRLAAYERAVSDLIRAVARARA